MTIDTQTSDRLLTEIERQQKYLAKLPDDFQFPLFNAAQALESRRHSGYRNTAAAAREIVDNPMEAGATRIDVCIAKPKQLKQYRRSESISAIAFIDNGAGLLPKMAQQALRLIHPDERPVVEVAMLTGISRFVLHRRIDQHCAMFRAAA